MDHRYDQPQLDFIAKLAVLCDKHLPAAEAALMKEFLRRSSTAVAPEDIEGRDINTFYQELQTVWKFFAIRKRGDIKIKIFNPDLKTDGWVSPHTIIMVAQEDMPFLIDSIRMELERRELHVHSIRHVADLPLIRNAAGELTHILSTDDRAKATTTDAMIYVEIDRQTEASFFAEIEEALRKVLMDVVDAVTDWQAMRDQLKTATMEFAALNSASLDPQELAESRDFLQWLDNNFIFLGYRTYDVAVVKGEKMLNVVPGSGLGVLKDVTEKTKLTRPYAEMSLNLCEATESSQLLVIAKTNTISTVHRSAYTDLISIHRFNQKGELIGEHRFVGLYTSKAYSDSPTHIPFLRHKVASVMRLSGLPKNDHAGKALLHILETFPRDDLIQISINELLSISMGILHLQERPRVRLFIRRDLYSRFYSCFVFLPSDRFNISLCDVIGKVLTEKLGGSSFSYVTYLADSSHLIRVHYMIRVKPEEQHNFDTKAIEKMLSHTCRLWEDELHDRLIELFGEAEGIPYFNKYRRAFSSSYKESYQADVAIADIRLIETLSEVSPLVMNTYQVPGEEVGAIHLRLFRREQPIPLSDVLPLLENMGLRVMGESPYRLKLPNNAVVWINDFSLQYAGKAPLDIGAFKVIFEEAFLRVWEGDAESDGFNKLVLLAGLTWKQVMVLRAYAKYLRQIGFNFSQAYIGEALVNNASIAAKLMMLFKKRFALNVVHDEAFASSMADLVKTIETEMDRVSSLDEDRILRRFLEVIQLTIRTNYFQRDKEGRDKIYVSFKIKLDASKINIPELPLPLPMVEIFVYSTRVEGVHLRGGKVARGGLRWSDRREDFRTEVLGLMKAQQVKNAVIVPAGSKGGFVPKLSMPGATRDDILKEGIECYRIFIRGLLDLTDNVVATEIVPPSDVVRYDEDDSYLVVAADKGTATFSDFANQISKEYGFWLGDAFASGGSAGYDHKKMAITARGAWESVKRHFYKLGVDPQTRDITVVGIGDMAGDVFGNGMLLSEHIKLVAAFNHMHIFIDPNPDPKISFEERKRLFHLPRSAWSDYDKSKMSKGGGIYERSAKLIVLSSEAQVVLGLEKAEFTPFELMKAILEAPVDLLWNGGIGTYVKATNETHQQVGDRANDLIRIDAPQLRCKVVGEGGNLGFTQLARVEYALKGGLIYTDFIDNSAGVNCSDHEVNIKILLNDVVSRKLLTEEERNVLLAEMTDDIAALVLDSNFQQTHAINLSASSSLRSLALFGDYIKYLEKDGKINRALEFLPDSKALLERKASGRSLVQPEVAVLIAYSKNTLKADLLKTVLPDDPYFLPQLRSEFPPRLFDRYSEYMNQHKLRREIVATQLSNEIVNRMGVHFIYRLQQETGAPIESIVRAYSVVEAILNLSTVWRDIQELGAAVPTDKQYAMMMQVSHLVRRSTRWVLRHRLGPKLTIQIVIDQFKESFQILLNALPAVLSKNDQKHFARELEALTKAQVPMALATTVAKFDYLLPALDILDASAQNKFDVESMAKVYFTLGEKLKLNWLRDQIKNYNVDNRWEELSRASLRDDLDFLQRKLSVSVLRMESAKKTALLQVEVWVETFSQILERWYGILSSLEVAETTGLIKYSVALRSLLDITQLSDPITLMAKEK